MNGKGQYVADAQRDRMYTNHLAESLCRAYRQDNVVLSTHLAAFAGWHSLAQRYPRLNTYQLVLLSPHERWVDRGDMISVLRTLLEQIEALVQQGLIHAHLPENAEAVLQQAIDIFGRFHTRAALDFEDWRILVDPRLALYYGNRLVGYGLQLQEKS
jgi:glycerol-3-phosphate O-acyltransferase